MKKWRTGFGTEAILRTTREAIRCSIFSPYLLSTFSAPRYCWVVCAYPVLGVLIVSQRICRRVAEFRDILRLIRVVSLPKGALG